MTTAAGGGARPERVVGRGEPRFGLPVASTPSDAQRNVLFEANGDIDARS